LLIPKIKEASLSFSLMILIYITQTLRKIHDILEAIYVTRKTNTIL